MRVLESFLAWVDGKRSAFGLALCRSGRHQALIWLGCGERYVPVTRANEMMYATGFMQRFALWNGWCPRCGQAVEWADHDPIKYMRDGDALAAYEARNAYRRAQRRAKQNADKSNGVASCERSATI